jgi:RNA polymerase sigma-B factor
VTREASTSNDSGNRQRTASLLVELQTLPVDDPRRARIRDELVELLIPLAHHLAGRFRDRGEPLDDLQQVAMIGLINAIDRFDPSAGFEFSTFATPTILGEIKRHFRDRGWAIRVPRRLQEMRQTLNVATEELTQQLGRQPTSRELAAHLGIGVEDVLEGMQSSMAYSTVSIDPLIRDEGETTLSERLGIRDAAMEAVENREALTAAVASLPARERKIIHLRYVEGMTQTQIAEDIGVSQMHVSRLLARVLAQLRRELTALDP